MAFGCLQVCDHNFKRLFSASVIENFIWGYSFYNLLLKNFFFYFEIVLDLQKMYKDSIESSHRPFTRLLLLTSYTEPWYFG